MKNKRLLAFIAVPLLVPFVAMQFIDEVNWSVLDFVVMGSLLLGTGLICEMILRRVKKTTKIIIYILVVLGAFLLIWLELAVGIF